MAVHSAARRRPLLAGGGWVSGLWGAGIWGSMSLGTPHSQQSWGSRTRDGSFFSSISRKLGSLATRGLGWFVFRDYQTYTLAGAGELPGSNLILAQRFLYAPKCPVFRVCRPQAVKRPLVHRREVVSSTMSAPINSKLVGIIAVVMAGGYRFCLTPRREAAFIVASWVPGCTHGYAASMPYSWGCWV